MLTALREGAKNSLIMKFIVFGFIGLGVGGLVLMDVQGYFRDGGMSSGIVVSAGHKEVGLQEFDQRLRRVINQQQIPQDIAYRFGFPMQVARSIGNDLMIQSYAGDKGLIADEESVAEQLRRYVDPNRAEGESAEQTLRRVAASVGVGPNRFIEVIEDQVTRQIILDAYEKTAAITPPELLQAYGKASRQKRSINTLFLAYDSQKVKGEENEEVLKAHYESMKGTDFSIPQEKTLRYAILDMQTALDAAPEPETAEITAYYRQNIDRFTKPRRILMTQAVFDQEDAAIQAFDRLSAGESLEEIAEDHLRPQGEFTSDGLPPALSAAVFDSEEMLIAPVETAFGFHIARIDERIAEAEIPLDEIKEDIAKEIRSLTVEEEFFAELDRLEDIAGQEATLDTLAGQFSLSIQTLDKVKPDQSSRLTLQEEDEPAETVFPQIYNQPEGKAGDLIPLADTRYLIAETAISKQLSFQPYEQVRGKVIADWRASRRQQAARDRAREITASGQALSETGEKTRAVNNLEEGQTPPAPLNEQALNTVFAAVPNSGPQQIALDKGILLFEISDISFADADDADQEEIAETLQETQAQAVLAGLQNYLKAVTTVKINSNLIERMYTPQNQEQSLPLAF